jgi:hypothetical protein
MEDLLQYIDLDYYRSAQLLIARAEVAQLRRETSVSVRTDPACNTPTGAPSPAGDRNTIAERS